MILSTKIKNIWLAQHKVDFRKQHDGLLAEAFKLGLDPHRGDVVIFIGRMKNRIKVLYGDPTGLWVSSKRFTQEAMKTNFRFLTDPSCSEITQAELAMVLEGAAYSVSSKVATYDEDHHLRQIA